MTDRHEVNLSACANCPNEIEVSQNWTAGGMNDYGGWVLKCSACGHIFHYRLGRDINHSRVGRGASIQDAYDDAVGDKNDVLKKYGLV